MTAKCNETRANAESISERSLKWIDLTRPIVEGMSVYPGNPLFQLRAFAEHRVDGFRGSEITLSSHLGTHVDFPYHFFIDGETLDSFPVDFFIGRGAVVDFSSVAGPNSERRRTRNLGEAAALRVEDVEPYASIFSSASFVFLRVDWSSRFGERDYYTDFPSLSEEVCDWLLEFMNLRALGLETPSLVALPCDDANERLDDETPSSPFHSEMEEFLPPAESRKRDEFKSARLSDATFATLDSDATNADAECHRILLGRRPAILIIEGLMNLERLPSFGPSDVVDGVASFDPSRTFEVSCLPLPIVGADGCPTRVVAGVRDDIV